MDKTFIIQPESGLQFDWKAIAANPSGRHESNIDLVAYKALYINKIAQARARGDTMPLRNVTTGLYYSEILQAEGFEQQDKILTIDGVEPETLSDAVQAIIIEGKRNVVVLRGTDTVALTMSEDLGTRYLAAQNAFDRVEREKSRADKSYTKQHYVLITEWIPFVVDTVIPEMPAAYAGIEKGDSLVAVDGVPTPCAVMVTLELQKHPCDSITIDYYRAGEQQTAHLFIGDQAKMGVAPRNQLAYFELEHTDYNFFEARVWVIARVRKPLKPLQISCSNVCT